MTPAGFAVFGQELYFDESIRAIEALADVHAYDELRTKIADLLPHQSSATRTRIASKIIQRFFRAPDGKSPATAFLRLVNVLKRESARRDLLFWRTARTDPIISAIAGEIFLPYFVLGTVPAGYDEPSFRMANTGTLFSVDTVISRDFVVEYARRAWNFDSARTVTLSLRIMRQAEILDATHVTVGKRRVLGYCPRPHSLSLEAFTYCLYEEFLEGGPAPVLSIDRVQNAVLVKTFLLNRLQVESLLKSAGRKGLIELVSLPGRRHIRLPLPDLDALVRTLGEGESKESG